MSADSLTRAERNTLLDARELRRERETKQVDRGYRLAAAWEEWRSARRDLIACGLMAEDSAITDAGLAALERAS